MLRPTIFVLLLFCLPLTARAAEVFHFEDSHSLDDMRGYIEKNVPLGTPQAEVRQLFVTQGGGTLKVHPSQKGVEKYIYDINLCGSAIFVWNISADYDAAGKLVQAYVNGRRVFMDGKKPQALRYDADDHTLGNMRMINSARRWPQITKGIKKMPYQLFDADGNIHTIDDQYANGAGLTYTDPLRLNEMTLYREVEPWRSVFDADEAEQVHMYADCTGAPVIQNAAPVTDKPAAPTSKP